LYQAVIVCSWQAVVRKFIAFFVLIANSFFLNCLESKISTWNQLHFYGIYLFFRFQSRNDLSLHSQISIAVPVSVDLQ